MNWDCGCGDRGGCGSGDSGAWWWDSESGDYGSGGSGSEEAAAAAAARAPKVEVMVCVVATEAAVVAAVDGVATAAREQGQAERGAAATTTPLESHRRKLSGRLPVEISQQRSRARATPNQRTHDTKRSSFLDREFPSFRR